MSDSQVCVVHETPGLLDVRALTTMGLSAKPGAASPIGRFGTGLKYALAVLTRLGIPVSIWIGEEEWVLGPEEGRFRGQEYTGLHLRRRRGVTGRWMRTQLPFTTAYGRDWELWQALRELHANTLDEGGTTYELPPGGTTPTRQPVPQTTRIVVSGEAYAQEFRALGEVFLPEYERISAANYWSVQVRRRETRHMYWRGMRAGALPKPALHTWSVDGELRLTEDRTIAEPWAWISRVRDYVAERCDDEVLIERVLRADEDTFEGSIDWDEGVRAGATNPTSLFVRLATLHRSRRTVYIVEREVRATEVMHAERPWQRQLLDLLDNPHTSAQVLGMALQSHRFNVSALLRASLEQNAGCLTPAEAAGSEPTPAPPEPEPAVGQEDDVPF